MSAISAAEVFCGGSPFPVSSLWLKPWVKQCGNRGKHPGIIADSSLPVPGSKPSKDWSYWDPSSAGS